MSKIKLKSSLSSKDIEEYLLKVYSFDTDEIEITLPINYHIVEMFTTALLFQLINTITRRFRNIILIFPIKEINEENIRKLLDKEANYLAVIMAWRCKIITKEGTDLKPHLKLITSEIRKNMNSFELFKISPPKGGAFFLPCFDHFMPNGLLNSFYLNESQLIQEGEMMYSPFSHRLNHFLARYNLSSARKSLGSENTYQTIIEIVYELILNTHEWARTDVKTKELSPNTRGSFIKLHKIKSDKIENENSITEYLITNNFSKNSNQESYFVEISVFDSGPGLVRRFNSTSHIPDEINDQVSIVKKCLTKHFTTSTAPQSIMKGLGLDKVLKLINNKGFIKIRTAECCLYRNMIISPYKALKNIQDNELFDWNSQNKNYTKFPPIEGTLISILYPLTIN